MSVAEAVTFPKFLAGLFIPTNNTGVLTKGRDDDNITDDKDALGVAPFRGVGIGVSFFERNFPVGLVGLTVDAEDLSEWSDEVDGVLFHSRDTPGAGKGRFPFGGAFVVPLFLAVFQAEAAQDVFFLGDAINNKDFVAHDGGTSEALFEFGFPEKFRAFLGEGFEKVRFGGESIAGGPEKVRPVNGCQGRKGEE